jgi:AraC family transcriptional regulator of adaptative response/methylated-DNA-[protein]-cysteine methyltransferase
MNLVVTPSTGGDELWLSVVRRDVLADGLFVYAVRTTRIYCRPSCPTRMAKRENVSFYATCAEAEVGGIAPVAVAAPMRLRRQKRTRPSSSKPVD